MSCPGDSGCLCFWRAGTWEGLRVQVPKLNVIEAATRHMVGCWKGAGDNKLGLIIMSHCMAF